MSRPSLPSESSSVRSYASGIRSVQKTVARSLIAPAHSAAPHAEPTSVLRELDARGLERLANFALVVKILRLIPPPEVGSGWKPGICTKFHSRRAEVADLVQHGLAQCGLLLPPVHEIGVFTNRLTRRETAVIVPFQQPFSGDIQAFCRAIVGRYRLTLSRLRAIC